MSNKRIAGKSAIITGGASGIGLATARRFLEEGASVLIGDYNQTSADNAVEQLREEGFGNKVHAHVGDVSKEDDVEALTAKAVELYGSLDIMFNNAGIGGAIGTIVETEVEHWDATFAVTMRGVFLGVKHAAKYMIEQGSGAIINTSSIAGMASGVPPTAYSASKAAVLSFTKNAANELAEHRIRVNAVCPGIIFTTLMHGGNEVDAENAMREVQPWPDRGDVNDIANAVLYLACDESRFVTGESLVVDGGYLANGLLRMNPLPGGKIKPDYAGITYGLTGKSKDVRWVK